jgi:polyisoprenoid-binding protein YceI
VARYRIVPERSKVSIEARSTLHPIHSTTDGLEGYVDMELGPDGEVDLGSPPAARLSLPVARLSSGNRMEDRELQKRIDARRFPDISGVLGGMEREGSDGDYKVRGEINFRGVSRQHEDIMTVDRVDGQTIRLAGKSRFDIRDFGMQPPRILVLQVYPEVEVAVDIVAVKEA